MFQSVVKYPHIVTHPHFVRQVPSQIREVRKIIFPYLDSLAVHVFFVIATLLWSPLSLQRRRRIHPPALLDSSLLLFPTSVWLLPCGLMKIDSHSIYFKRFNCKFSNENTKFDRFKVSAHAVVCSCTISIIKREKLKFQNRTNRSRKKIEDEGLHVVNLYGRNFWPHNSTRLLWCNTYNQPSKMAASKGVMSCLSLALISAPLVMR